MSDERMIRVDNLKLLKVLKTLTDRDIAISIGLAEKSAGRIGKILAGDLPFTEKTARRIEVAYNLGHGWMDQVHMLADFPGQSDVDKSKPHPPTFPNVEDTSSPPLGQVGGRSAEAQDLSHVKITEDGTTAQRAPFIRWGRLVVELSVSNEEVQAEAILSLPREASDKCKWTQVEQDHPRLRIMRGDVIALDPVDEKTPLISGKVYLFQDEEGNLFLGEYRPLANKDFEAIPDSGLPLEKKRHGVKVLAKKVGSWDA